MQPARIHGVLVTVGGIGLLLRGPSGTGKSECALELLRRGHSLVADDLVEISPDTATAGLIGASPAALAGRLEVQDIGVVEVERIFGPLAIRTSQRIHAVVDLVPPAPESYRQRPLDPIAPVTLLGHALPAYVLRASGVTAVSNRLEVIARLLSPRVHGA
jgi:serine kinase of HPr protein (carbohydrate metabolism regulator)